MNSSGTASSTAPSSANSIEIVEVGPRDGLQSESQVLPTAVKVQFVQRLLAAGLKRIEVASFVNPKRVPQMADAEAMLTALAGEARHARFIGLILNRKGFERARAAGCTEVGMAIAASESFSQRNQGLSIDEAVESWLDVAKLAHAAGIRAQITLSVAFGCPFEGEVPVARVRDLAERLAAGEPDEIAVADTIGVAVPTQVTEMLANCARHCPGRGCARISTTLATRDSQMRTRPWKQACWHWTRVAAASAVARSRPRPPAMSRQKISSTCCTVWGLRPASICRR